MPKVVGLERIIERIYYEGADCGHNNTRKRGYSRKTLSASALIWSFFQQHPLPFRPAERGSLLVVTVVRRTPCTIR